MRRTFTRLSVSLVAAIMICVGLVYHTYANKVGREPLTTEEPTIERNVGGDDPWSPAELMQAEELARLLGGEQKPVVLQIGIVHLYRLSHIPGSKYAGPASASEGLDALKKEAQGISRDTQLVYYCGCCPWADCPNTRPAYKVLRQMGFKKIKVLYLPQNFTQDWVAKGFPVEKSD
jgi:thiosulfate/3-mercaptopyruvate sulfurtransferase